MKSDKVRVAVVGCGRFSEPGHLFYYRMHPKAELVAVCDAREEAARKMARRYDAPAVYTNYEEMLDRAKPEAVSICTPTFLHADQTVAAAERGIHVLCEKPMAPSPADGERMTAACRAAGVRLHVGYHMRYDRGIMKLKRLLDQRTYGDCFQAELTWIGLSTFGNVPVVNRAMEWADRLGVSKEGFSPGWRFTDARCPGGVFEVICHLIDMAVWFFGAPKRVQGETRTLTPGCTRSDHAAILLTGAGDEIVYVTMSHKSLSLREEEKGLFRCTGGNILMHTDSTRQAMLPAHLRAQTDEGILGREREIPVAPLPSALTLPHYHKIDNFLRDVRGRLPVDEEANVCRGENAMEVDRVVANFVSK